MRDGRSATGLRGLAGKLLLSATRIFEILGATALLALAAVTGVEVVWRYVLRDPIFGVEDLSSVILIVVAAASVAVAARTDSHVRVDFGDRWLPKPLRRGLAPATRVITLCTIGLACYALVESACGAERACITSNLNIEHEPFYYLLAAAMGVYGISELLKPLALRDDDSGPRHAEESD